MATPRKSLPVLAYLLLHRDATVARSFLSFLVWPDEDEDGARSKLRATLFDLVRALPPAPEGHWILADGAGVRWNAPDVAVDVEEFDTALNDPERLGDAVELYKGDFLEALYDEWLTAPRERYRSAYLDALKKLIARCRRRLQLPAAIGYAKRLLEIDPLREDVARQLIALHYEAGDRARALDEFERFERRIREELDVAPMPETLALRETILRSDALPPDDDPPAAAAVSAPAAATLPFVGRAGELERLRDAWSRASRGRGGVVFVGGDPGIGKSRLVLEFAREVEESGGRAIVGATGAPETMPYQAFVEALRSALPLISSVKLDAVWLAVLATLLPELSSQTQERAAPHIDPENEQARLLGAMARLMLALAQSRPLLLVLEDLHWAGDATIAALAFIARRLSLARILVIATYRDNETISRHPLRRARIDAVAEGTASSMLLAPLSLEDVEELTGQTALSSRDTAGALLQASGGHPLLLTELLQEPGPRSDARVRLTDLVQDRIERLSPQARSVAEICALIGPRFSRELARTVSGWDGPAFADALDELLDRRIVQETAGRGLFDYAFAHQTICDVVERTSVPERAADRHRRTARAIEALYPERVPDLAADLARHYEAAGMDDNAAAHFLTAGRRALATAAIEECKAYLDRGLALATAPPLRVALLIERGRLCQRTSDHAGLGRVADDLAPLARSLDDRESELIAAEFRSRYAFATQDEAAARAALDRMRELALAAGPRWRAIYFLEEARNAYSHADVAALECAAQSALEAAREWGDHAAIARALARLADMEWHRGSLDKAHALLERAQAEALESKDGAVELEAWRAAFQVAYHRGDVAGCTAIAGRWLERSAEVGDRLAEASGRLRMAIALVRTRHDIARTRAEFAGARAIFEELGWQRGVAGTLLNGAVLEFEVADFALAAQMMERALAVYVAVDDRRGKVSALANLATFHAALGLADQAVREGTEALELARRERLGILEAQALENLAIATEAAGKPHDALRLADEALALHKELNFGAWTGRLLGELALWHMELGDVAGAKTRVEQMLAQGTGVWAEWPQRSHWAAAVVAHATGDEAGAQREHERARALIAEIESELEGDALARYRAAPWNKPIIAGFDGSTR